MEFLASINDVSALVVVMLFSKTDSKKRKAG
jgi:hypothetical protein